MVVSKESNEVEGHIREVLLVDMKGHSLMKIWMAASKVVLFCGCEDGTAVSETTVSETVVSISMKVF